MNAANKIAVNYDDDYYQNSIEASNQTQGNPFANQDKIRKDKMLEAKGKKQTSTLSSEIQALNKGAQFYQENYSETGKDYIVQFRNTCSLSEMYSILEEEDYTLIGFSERRLICLNTTDVDAFLTKASDKIESYEVSKVRKSEKTANDSYYANQWAIPAQNLTQAWDITTGTNTVFIAVIDSGIDRNHPDLDQADIRKGWDYLYNESCYRDSNGHGTNVTGVIAAETNNYVGIAGTTWNAAVIPLLVMDYNGGGYSSDIINAIYDAADVGCKIINLSLGSSSYSYYEDQAIQYAYSKGCIVVAAAGNNGNGSLVYPASYNNVVSVGSINSNLTKSYFSNYNNYVDVCAPGENILTTDSYVNYKYVNGTSFSAPYVTGIAALVASVRPDLTPDQFISSIANSCYDLGNPGYDMYYGYGLINAKSLLTNNGYEVIFNSQGGSAVSSNLAFYNTTIINPKAPIRSGFIFGGWFKESSCINVWNFSTDTIKGNTTLYAKWISSPAIPTLPKAVSSGYNSVLISWAAVSGSNGYEVYRSTSSTGVYTLVATTSAINYNNSGLVTNSNYYYKVRAYKLVGTTKHYSGFSSIVSAKPIPSIPTNFKVISSGYSSINTSWAAVNGSSGYEIYRSTTNTGVYSRIATTSSTSYNNTGLATNASYYYKVRAYRLVGTTKVYGGFSNILVAKPIPSTPTSISATRYSSTSIRVDWSSVSGATGYQVYRATSSTGTYSLIKTTTSLSTIDTGLVNGKYYYYKVRAYRIVGTTKVYGVWTTVKYAKPY